MGWQVLAPEFMPTSKLFLTRSDLENVRKWEYKVSALRLRLQRFPAPRAAQHIERGGNEPFGLRSATDL